jgi:tripeptidyl-peptidase-1
MTLAASAGMAVAHVERAPALSNGWAEAPFVADDMETTGDGVKNKTTVAPHARQSVTFALHVTERNLDKVKEIAIAVSTPGSSTYGEYLDADTLAALTAPEPAHANAVRSWLRDAVPLAHGSTIKEIQGRRFEITLPVADAEALLQTTFRFVINSRTGQRALVAGDYTIPDQIKDATAAVFGLHGLPLPPRDHATSDSPPGGIAQVTPAVIKAKYGTSAAPTTKKSSGNKQAVAEFQGQTMDPKDLKQFFQQYVPNAPPGAETVSKFVGDPGRGTAQVEANLDIQYIMGVAPGIDTEFWSYQSADFCADLKNWTSMLLAVGGDAPLVTSVSYGWQGPLIELGCADSNYAAVDADFAKLAASGITIIFASADSGSGYHPGYDMCAKKLVNTELQGPVVQVIPNATMSYCLDLCASHNVGWTYDGPADDSGTGTCTILTSIIGTKSALGKTSGGVPRLMPSWPASSPWVTAVGATRFVGQQEDNEEMATDQFGSGGGFSYRFDRTKAGWQSAAVEQYFQIVPKGKPFPPSTMFNAAGRGTPDVAALGEGYQVVLSGAVMSVGGTSASAPAFAAIISLLNEHRLQNGGKHLGFLNPWLFANPGMFTDVTKGTNAIGRQTGPLPFGFNCTKGWDPATGLGTPKWDAMVDALP